MILAIFTRFHAFVLYVLIKYNIIIIFVTPRPQPEQKPDPSPSGTGCQPESGRVPIFLPDPDPNRTLLGSFAVLLEEGGDAVVKYDAALFCGERRGSCSWRGRSLLLRWGYCFLSNG